MPTAVLVDAGFFVKRFSHIYTDKNPHDSRAVARTLHQMALAHLTQKKDNREEKERQTLHRIIVYDCPPLDKRAHKPVSGASINFGKSDIARFRTLFHQELRKLRKVALRLGELGQEDGWVLKPQYTKPLANGTLRSSDLNDDHFKYGVHQKGVDMKIALDIATLSLKGQVDQIVLVAGDSDFVPAAKQARREGVDFILDPMWNPILPSLNEHIDGLRSTAPKPGGADTKP